MSIKRKFILWLMQTRFYSWVLLKIIPFLRFTCYYTALKGWQYQRGYKLLQPGDIVLTTDKKKLTSFLIPGEFTHAALCVNVGGEWEISEMTHNNYCKSAFMDLCKEADRVVIIRCKDWDVEYTQKVIEKCKSFVDVKYDVDFDLGVKALYCSELVYQSDFEHRLQCSLEDLAGLGRPYISPTGIWRVYTKGKNADLIWDSDDEIVYTNVKTFLNYSDMKTVGA